MNKTIAQCCVISASAVWIILTFAAPWVMSDKNLFLAKFISDGGLLSFLGVVVTITLASAANLHLELNKMEEKVQKRIFNGTRAAVKKSAFWLIGMLLIAILLATAKPLVCTTETMQSFFNGAALLIVLFNILVLIDLTQVAFKLEPSIRDNS